MKFIIASLANIFILSVVRKGNGQNGSGVEKKPALGFEGDEDIPNARLAHFPAQIGHWGISLGVMSHNR